MNKPVITILLLLLQTVLFAQITIDQSDMPQAGDTIRLSTTLEIGNINYEETGSDFDWDFSELTFLTQRVDTFVSVSQTPVVYQVFFFLSANLASPGQNFDQLPGFQVTDYYNFYKNSNSNFKSVGFGVTLNGIPIPNKFNDADIIYQFPLSAGDIDSSLSTYAMDVPGLGYYGGWKKRKNYADGWGELTTPYGTFETIRVKSDITQYDSLYIDSLGFGIPILRNFTEYKWLGKDFGLPLCTVTDDGLLPTIVYIDSARSQIATTHEEIIENSNISIHPNPFLKSFTVGYNKVKGSNVVIRIFNLSGKIVFENRFKPLYVSGNKQSVIIGDLNFPGGIYLLNVQIGNKNYLHKLIKLE